MKKYNYKYCKFGRSLFVFSLSILFLLLSISCNNMFELPQPDQQTLPSGYGAFSLHIAEASSHSRTILPNINSDTFVGYLLEFTNTETLEKQSFYRLFDNLTVTLPIGSYNLKIIAFVEYIDENNNKPVASGSLNNIEIAFNKTVTGEVVLSALGISDDKTGIFSWVIGLPVGVCEAYMEITSLKNGMPDVSSIQTWYFTGGDEINSKESNDSLILISGYYRVIFTMKRNINMQTISWRETLHVYQNMTSHFEYDFNESHFTNNFSVSSEAEWNAVVNTINTGGNNREYTITITDDFSLSGRGVDNTFSPIDLAITIQGDKTISLSSTGYLLCIGNRQNIIMQDVKLKGINSNTTSLVLVGISSVSEIIEEATFTMQGNASVYGNTSRGNLGYGGCSGVYVRRGVFNMYGGEISGNSSIASMFNRGGGVEVSSNNAIFNMYGGKISGNTASAGGGVMVWGTFNMYDGEISGNVADDGGGVSIASSATFNMYDGEISRNTATNGSGVYLYLGNFRITGGTIYGIENDKGNIASSGNSAVLYRSGGTAGYGTVSGSNFVKNGDLATNNFTIKVIDGVLQIPAVFHSIAPLTAWLATQPTNSITTPYNISLNVSTLPANILNNHFSNRYINLDLSGSTFTSIPDSAFRGCTVLNGIIILPNSVTTIGSYAFRGCTNLTGVTIGNNVASIGSYGSYYNVFFECTSLISISVASDNLTYSSVDGVLYNKDKTTLFHYPIGKSGSFTIPDSVTVIKDEAFKDCTMLYDITIPNSVTVIGYGAFDSCRNLTSVTLGNSVETIGVRAFYYCINLTSVNFPDSVKSIGQDAFRGTNLTNVYLGNSVNNINATAFSNDKFTSINVATGNQTYSSIDGVLYDKNNSKLIIYPDGKTGIFSIPNSVVIIGEKAFSGCLNLTSVVIPESVKVIEGNAFYTSRLTSVTFDGTIPSSGFNRITVFYGDLRDKFYANDTENGTPGRYTRTQSGSVWTRVN